MAALGEPTPDALSEEAGTELRTVATPNRSTVEDVSSYLDIPVDRFIKTLIFEKDDGQPSRRWCAATRPCPKQAARRARL